MAKGRMIDNAITQDKRINQLTDDTSRLAYTWLITFADCEGRTPGDPAVVRSMLFPRREDITITQMEGYIKQWSDIGIAIWYEAKGDLWIYFPAFFNHNKINKQHESASKIPKPPLNKDDTKINLTPDNVATNSEQSIDNVQTKINQTPDKLPLNLNQVKLNQSNLNQSNSDDDDDKSSIPPNIFQLYEQNIGMVQPLLVDELKEAEKEYSPQWIREAFATAVNANARNWSYVHKCLVNRKNGYSPEKNGKKPARHDTPEAIRKYAEWEKK